MFVSVVECYFVRLKDVGMPLSVCIQLHENKLSLGAVLALLASPAASNGVQETT